eukprot:TRINITY_DN3561_c0_g1_i1.p1 TRINITY_DN3561_c0_g1~~TRINITY_DN3561_c0_g1_i1.p1  ORF type:complete len:976 (-),score=220.14 TRINITY_DN3561_c0_g1_i1:110-3037(-)
MGVSQDDSLSALSAGGGDLAGLRHEELSNEEDEALPASASIPAVASSVPLLVRRRARLVQMDARLRSAEAGLQEKLSRCRRNMCDFNSQVENHLKDVGRTERIMQARLEALDAEKADLQRRSEHLDAEKVQSTERLREKADEKGDTDARIQRLMDRLVALLSSGSSATDGRGSQVLPAASNGGASAWETQFGEVLEELAASEQRLGDQLQKLHEELEAARAENLKAALRLSDEQRRTKRLHDTLCSLQSELFSRRHEKITPAVSSSARPPRLITPAASGVAETVAGGGDDASGAARPTMPAAEPSGAEEAAVSTEALLRPVRPTVRSQSDAAENGYGNGDNGPPMTVCAKAEHFDEDRFEKTQDLVAKTAINGDKQSLQDKVVGDWNDHKKSAWPEKADANVIVPTDAADHKRVSGGAAEAPAPPASTLRRDVAAAPDAGAGPQAQEAVPPPQPPPSTPRLQQTSTQGSASRDRLLAMEEQLRCALEAAQFEELVVRLGNGCYQFGPNVIATVRLRADGLVYASLNEVDFEPIDPFIKRISATVMAANRLPEEAAGAAETAVESSVALRSQNGSASVPLETAGDARNREPSCGSEHSLAASVASTTGTATAEVERRRNSRVQGVTSVPAAASPAAVPAAAGNRITRIPASGYVNSAAPNGVPPASAAAVSKTPRQGSPSPLRAGASGLAIGGRMRTPRLVRPTAPGDAAAGHAAMPIGGSMNLAPGRGATSTGSVELPLAGGSLHLAPGGAAGVGAPLVSGMVSGAHGVTPRTSLEAGAGGGRLSPPSVRPHITATAAASSAARTPARLAASARRSSSPEGVSSLGAVSTPGTKSPATTKAPTGLPGGASPPREATPRASTPWRPSTPTTGRTVAMAGQMAAPAAVAPALSQGQAAAPTAQTRVGPWPSPPRSPPLLQRHGTGAGSGIWAGGHQVATLPGPVLQARTTSVSPPRNTVGLSAQPAGVFFNTVGSLR